MEPQPRPLPLALAKAEPAGEAATHRSRSPLRPSLLSGTEGKAPDGKGRREALQRESSAEPAA